MKRVAAKRVADKRGADKRGADKRGTEKRGAEKRATNNRSADVRLDDRAGRLGPIFVDRASHFSSHTHSGGGSGSNRRQSQSVTHDFAALAFYVGGGARMEQRATWRLEPGDVLIVPAGEPHRMIEARKPDMWRLGFCVPCLASDSTAAASLLEPFERVRDGASPVVRIPPERREFLESLFREFSVIPEGAADADLVRRSLLTLIISEVARAARAAATSPTTTSRAGASGRSAASGIVTDTLRYIERHCLEPLTLTAIAAAMRRTPSYITTALTRATGRSAVAWIIAGRMAEARRRLLHSDERIDIIAERVGYADPTHFIRLFRRTHGATPAGWRAAQRATRVRRRPPSPS
jgi:AraC family transcriptional regulator, transcriptional activator of pobA